MFCSDRYTRSGYNAPESYPGKSFHESAVRGSVKRTRSRSPNRNGSSLWGDRQVRSRSRSRSVERYDRAPPARERSPRHNFYKTGVEWARSPPLLKNSQRLSPRAAREDELEEGMIPADE